MEIVKKITASKKFWYAFGALALLLFSDSIGINDQEVNNIIKELYEDFALIRRELINFGYMQRDPYKSEYKVLTKELSKEKLEKIEDLQKRLK